MQGKAFNLFQYTDAVLFFGTPFHGTHPWYQKDLPRLAEARKVVDREVFEYFRQGSEVLSQLRRNFYQKRGKHKKPNIGCFEETQLSDVGKILGDEKIPKVSITYEFVTKF